jgi:hypothetical protein
MNRPSGLNIRVQIAILFVVLLALGIALYLFSASNAPSGTKAATFQVEASGGYASITWKAGSNHIDSATTVSTPWERTVFLDHNTQVILTVANPSKTGQVTCRILLDRKPWKETTGKAPQSGVACGGIIP